MNTHNYSNFGYTYPCDFKYRSEEAQTLLAGSYNFKVDEIEVFEMKN
jgi:hypothetical protein